jgi:hypothetical protein
MRNLLVLEASRAEKEKEARGGAPGGLIGGFFRGEGARVCVTSQDFIKFWGNFFCFYFECIDRKSTGI